MIILAFIPDEFRPPKPPKPEPAKASDGASKGQASESKKTEQKPQSKWKVTSKPGLISETTINFRPIQKN